MPPSTPVNERHSPLLQAMEDTTPFPREEQPSPPSEEKTLPLALRTTPLSFCERHTKIVAVASTIIAIAALSAAICSTVVFGSTCSVTPYIPANVLLPYMLSIISLAPAGGAVLLSCQLISQKRQRELQEKPIREALNTHLQKAVQNLFLASTRAPISGEKIENPVLSPNGVIFNQDQIPDAIRGTIPLSFIPISLSAPPKGPPDVGYVWENRKRLSSEEAKRRFNALSGEDQIILAHFYSALFHLRQGQDLQPAIAILRQCQDTYPDRRDVALLLDQLQPTARGEGPAQ